MDRGGGAGLLRARPLLLPFLGPSPLDLSRVWTRQEPDWSIFVQLRLSRTLLGLFAGAALALGGSVFQAMLRDALATPDTLGVSLGRVARRRRRDRDGLASRRPACPASGPARSAGAAVVLVLVVIAAATRQRDVSAYGLLLAGVATNSVCWALILLIHSLSGMSQSFAISRWLIGSLDAIDYRALAVFVAVVIVAAVLVVRRARQWNLLAVGEAWAETRGGDVRSLAALRIHRRIVARGLHGRADRADRLRRPRGAASGPRARQRGRSRPDALRVLLRRRAAGVVRRDGPRDPGASRGAGRRDHGVHRRAVSHVAAAPS